MNKMLIPVYLEKGLQSHDAVLLVNSGTRDATGSCRPLRRDVEGENVKVVHCQHEVCPPPPSSQPQSREVSYASGKQQSYRTYPLPHTHTLPSFPLQRWGRGCVGNDAITSSMQIILETCSRWLRFLLSPLRRKSP